MLYMPFLMTCHYWIDKPCVRVLLCRQIIELDLRMHSYGLAKETWSGNGRVGGIACCNSSLRDVFC